MDEHRLSRRQEQILQMIAKFKALNQTSPTPKEIGAMMLPLILDVDIESIDDQEWLTAQHSSAHRNVLTVLATLGRLGYVKRVGKGITLTDLGEDICRNIYEPGTDVYFKPSLPNRVAVFGYVTAGATQPDDLDVALDYSQARTVQIPNLTPQRTTYALEVVGQSMEHEGIFAGDMIIVEKFSDGEGPVDGELIVTRYSTVPPRLILLFSLGSHLSHQLDTGRRPQAVTDAFTQADCTLSESANFTVESYGEVWTIRDQDIKYILRKEDSGICAYLFDEEFESIASSHPRSGLTLKYYHLLREKGIDYSLLGWRRDNSVNPHVIKATRISPEGRVIGMYRRLRRIQRS